MPEYVALDTAAALVSSKGVEDSNSAGTSSDDRAESVANASQLGERIVGP